MSESPSTVLQIELATLVGSSPLTSLAIPTSMPPTPNLYVTCMTRRGEVGRAVVLDGLDVGRVGTS